MVETQIDSQSTATTATEQTADAADWNSSKFPVSAELVSLVRTLDGFNVSRKRFLRKVQLVV